MKKFLLSLLILPFVFASAEEHAPVGERQLSSEELVQQSQVMESEEMPPVSPTDPVNDEVAGFFWDGGYGTYYPISCHWIYAISAFQDSIGIEDGSIWQIDGYEAFHIRVRAHKTADIYEFPNVNPRRHT